MHNIKIIFKRLTDVLVKNRTLLICILIQNIILTLLVLIYANSIISVGKSTGELNYDQIKFFYNLIIYALLFAVYIFTPYFLSGSINNMVKNNNIDYLLSSKIKLNEIVYAIYLRGLSIIIILLVSAFPIACVSLYFGGVGVFRAIKLVIFLICLIVFYSSICIYISSVVAISNTAILLSYIVGLFVMSFQVYLLKYVISSNLILLAYIFASMVLSLIFVFNSSKCPILRR